MRASVCIPGGAVVLAGLLSVTGPAVTGSAAAQALSVPGSTTAVANASSLPDTPRFANVPGLPFDVVSTPDGRFTFVSSEGSGNGTSELLVYRGNGQNGHPVATVSLGGFDAAGMSFADHDHVLLVSGGSELVVIDVKKAERGAADAVTAQVPAPGAGGVEVAPTPDGRYAFESMEGSKQVDVFRLSGESRPHYVGAIPVESLPVGIAFSPDGSTAYVTSEETKAGNPNVAGTLSVIDVAAAERRPAKSVAHTVAAGSAPVRVVVSPDGSTVWVTARESDALLGFSASGLANGQPALVADVMVGAAPVGLAFFDGGKRLLVADSNRFQGTGQKASLAVIDLTGSPALVGYVTAHGFPRQMTLEPGGREMDVTNYDSSELETVPLAPLIAAPG